MRILSVAWECPQEPYGGLGVFISKLLPEMTVKHDVDHFCLHGYRRPLIPENYHGARVVRLREPAVDRNGGVMVLTAVMLGGELLSTLPTYDAVIAHDIHGSLVVASAKELGVKSTYYVHLWTFSPLDITAVDSADDAAANSKLTASQISSTAGREVRVVYPASPYPPADTPSNGSLEGEKTIVIPSRWQGNKNPSHILSVLEDVRKRVSVKVVVFGRGAELYKLPDWVINVGTVSEEEKLGLYRKADLVVQVGFPEPFGLVALEAVSQGSPVLVSNQSGVSEVLPPESTYTLENLADKIIQLLTNKSEREELWWKQRTSWIMQRTWRDVWRELEKKL